MKLKIIEFDLVWLPSIDIFNLRKYIINNFPDKADIVRWSIIEVISSGGEKSKKIIKINALVLT
tara:strand:- start:385 stop:576 length:192 start_codon:yes stop_codon:yes gene_type:complete